ncbi:ATP-dependent zinc protease [Pseudohalioglobus lutimaris]|uniref:Retropepsin-like aspartic endopeptidase domain-containing protein n=1 Tax=Pseudohalioglobus lutimaris TaxID=1737061 RepID=A0A2N5X592_9GAMM|nr:RimK/LysX family protein [Pseudohalioglobus lutimaris]PLW69653.1 hypothetical protein C0039_06485 [Pseudohalioglobus lutimaris]
MKCYHHVALFLLCLTIVGCTTTETLPEVAVAPPAVDSGASCPEPEPCAPCEVLQCPDPEVVEKIVEVPAPLPPMATTAGKMHLPIVGALERVLVEPAGMEMDARIDTGAETTSIHAENIQLVEKDGKRYVRFSLLDDAEQLVEQELRLRRRVLIKQKEGDPERRYVVRMWITLAGTRSRIDVNLSDREDFEYPLLVGRNFLVDTVIVDVSRRYTQGQ